MVKKQQSAAVPQFKFMGFENLEFSQNQQREIVEWVSAFGEEPFHAIVVLLEAGYKVSFGYDDYHGVNQASMTCKDPGSFYYGYCFTFKHVDVGRSILIFRYFYDTQLKDQLYQLGERQKEYDW